MAAQPLDVGDQMRRGVVAQFAQRRRAAGAALVEHHDVVMRGVEKAPVVGRAAGAGAAVQEDDRDAMRVARLLPIHRVDGIEPEHAAAERFDWRVELVTERGRDVHCMSQAVRRGA